MSIGAPGPAWRRYVYFAWCIALGVLLALAATLPGAGSWVLPVLALATAVFVAWLWYDLRRQKRELDEVMAYIDREHGQP